MKINELLNKVLTTQDRYSDTVRGMNPSSNVIQLVVVIFNIFLSQLNIIIDLMIRGSTVHRQLSKH